MDSAKSVEIGGAEVRRLLGAVLRRRRETGGFSLARVAYAAGISTAFLSEVERGRKDISSDRLARLAAALGVTAGELYLELGQQLGAGEQLEAVAWESDPRIQLRRMSQSLDRDALWTVARFTTFLAMTDGGQKKRQIGVLR